ncbi:unnamed protein product, partial [Iphiclides podalirius]
MDISEAEREKEYQYREKFEIEYFAAVSNANELVSRFTSVQLGNDNDSAASVAVPAQSGGTSGKPCPTVSDKRVTLAATAQDTELDKHALHDEDTQDIHILNSIQCDSNDEKLLKLVNDDHAKTLGLRWSCKLDTLHFSVNSDSSHLKPSKRSVLSTVGQVFDPLGLVNPCILQDDLKREDRICTLSRYQRTRALTKHFWTRYYKEYISELQRRNKWQRKDRGELRIGDLVVVKDDHLPPNRWLLGRVVHLHPGSDGIARVADVATSSGTIRRAYNRLCLLPSSV